MYFEYEPPRFAERVSDRGEKAICFNPKTACVVSHYNSIVRETFCNWWINTTRLIRQKLALFGCLSAMSIRNGYAHRVGLDISHRNKPGSLNQAHIACL